MESIHTVERIDHRHDVALADEIDGDQVWLAAALGGALLGSLAKDVGVVDGLVAWSGEGNEVVDDGQRSVRAATVLVIRELVDR